MLSIHYSWTYIDELDGLLCLLHDCSNSNIRDLHEDVLLLLDVLLLHNSPTSNKWFLHHDVLLLLLLLLLNCRQLLQLLSWNYITLNTYENIR
jgi:hypothetical protein